MDESKGRPETPGNDAGDDEAGNTQPGPAKKVGDATPNPLPDSPGEDEHGGGDPGRS